MRKAADAVIFKKKFWHPCVEKLDDIDWSKACGNGVGSGGGDAGIVGTVCVVMLGLLELPPELCCGSGAGSGEGSLLCACHSVGRP